jgi:hypothetical protein
MKTVFLTQGKTVDVSEVKFNELSNLLVENSDFAYAYLTSERVRSVIDLNKTFGSNNIH